jgi:hypothetical protein
MPHVIPTATRIVEAAVRFSKPFMRPYIKDLHNFALLRHGLTLWLRLSDLDIGVDTDYWLSELCGV